MYQLDSTAYWFLIACAVVLFYKVIIPASWKFGVVFIRTVFMFMEAKENDFPLLPILRALPKTLWRVWRSDLNTNYEYTEVCYFNFSNGKFESVLTKDHVWLQSLSLCLRRGNKKFALTFSAEQTAWLINEGERITLRFHIRTIRFSNGVMPVLMISGTSHAGIDSLVGFSLHKLIEVVKYYSPDIFAVAIESPLGVISHISTIPAEELRINSKVYQFFVIGETVQATTKSHLRLVSGDDGAQP